MDVKFRVQRYDPENDQLPHYEHYVVDLPDRSTVLDGLIKIKEQLDGSLSFRRACRAAICGSCGVRVNGLCRLACKTQLAPLLGGDGEILVEPLPNMPIIKDLIVDMESFWAKMEAVKPWLLPDEANVPEKEYFMSHDRARKLEEIGICIMCACCYGSCPEVTMNPDYLGPAQLNKAYRFYTDARDVAKKERLKLVDCETGAWECRTIFNCVDSCPKHIPITSSIQGLKRAAILRRLRFWEQ